jgi:hypothetical protein
LQERAHFPVAAFNPPDPEARELSFMSTGADLAGIFSGAATESMLKSLSE